MSSPERAFETVISFLRNVPSIADDKAGRKAAVFHYMCAAGVDVLPDDKLPLEQRMLFTGANCDAVIEQANAQDEFAHEALCEIAARLTSARRRLPLSLQRYIVGRALVPFQRKVGRNAVGNSHRNAAVVAAVKMVVDRGFKATRNEATTGESAVSIVARALERCGSPLSEKQVSQLWSERTR